MSGSSGWVLTWLWYGLGCIASATASRYAMKLGSFSRKISDQGLADPLCSPRHLQAAVARNSGNKVLKHVC